jgi:hypothetical protein
MQGNWWKEWLQITNIMAVLNPLWSSNLISKRIYNPAYHDNDKDNDGHNNNNGLKDVTLETYSVFNLLVPEFDI